MATPSENEEARKVVEKLDKETRDEIESIIDNLRAANQNDLEAIVIMLLEKILKKIIKEDGGKTGDEISGPEKDDLLEELKQLATELHQTGQLKSSKDAAQLVYYTLHKRFEKLLKKRKEKDLDYLNKKSKDQMEEELERMAIYELHKIMNPRQLAGETRLENFINNMIVGGLELAMKYEGGTKKELERYDAKFLEGLQEQHEAFTKSGDFAANIQKGRGSSGMSR